MRDLARELEEYRDLPPESWRPKPGDQLIGTEDRSARPSTVQEYAEQWLQTYTQIHCKPSTLRVHTWALRCHLLPAFGALTLPELSRPTIKAFLAEKVEAGLSRESIRNLLSALRGMLRQAVEDGHLPSNPAAGLGRFAKGRRTASINPLTPDEVGLLLQATEVYYSAYAPLILCAVLTGMREGELLTLQWGDIDFEGRFIEVCRNVYRGHVQRPKSGKTRRVDLAEPLAQRLKSLRDLRLAEAAVQGKDLKSTAWVFCNRDGGLMDAGHFYARIWQPLLRKAGLRAIRFHDLRHTYASLLIRQGESLAYIKEQLGHHSIQVTVDIYGHLIPGANKAAVDRLGAVLLATGRNPGATMPPEQQAGSEARASEPLNIARFQKGRQEEEDSGRLPAHLPAPQEVDMEMVNHLAPFGVTV